MEPSPQARRAHAGFTLLELMVSMALLVVVSALTFLVMRSSASATNLAQAKEVAQACVRDAMTAMMAELQLASTRTNDAYAPPVEAIRVVNESEIAFQTPVDDSGTRWSAPITYRFVNEDTVAVNARLDEGEDLDEDGALTRCILRIQGADVRPIGAANDMSQVLFALSPDGGELTITLAATKQVNDRRRDLIAAAATSRVHLVN